MYYNKQRYDKTFKKRSLQHAKTNYIRGVTFQKQIICVGSPDPARFVKRCSTSWPGRLYSSKSSERHQWLELTSLLPTSRRGCWDISPGSPASTARRRSCALASLTALPHPLLQSGSKGHQKGWALARGLLHASNR